MTLSLAATAVGVMLFAPTSASADPSQAIIEAARKEATQGKFVNMISSPKGESAQKAIMDAFQKRFNIKLDWEWLPLTSAVAAPRVVEQAKAKVPLPTVIGGFGYSTYEHMIVKNGLDLKVDWVGEFGTLFPTIKAAAVDGIIPRYHGRMLRQWDVSYVIVYNTDQLKAKDAPKSLQELTEPKWKGRFAMTNRSTAPLDILALELGVDGTVDLTKKLMANQPRFKAGPPAVVGAVATGEVAVGMGYTALADAQKKMGAPVDWVLAENLPLGPLFMFLLKDAPQPNLGKLFSAWMVTEGLKIQEEHEYLSFLGDKESPTTKAIYKANPNVKVIEARSDEDTVVLEKAQQEILKVYSAAPSK
ncbi:ABC transporter substrate-binding protein [Ferrovibrio sp.]|uniref:ABC transporter substrate-binding protein n=1 Tax=Ferrovibrio sp. TaxID=1917215 RepID=UPI003514A42B